MDASTPVRLLAAKFQYENKRKCAQMAHVSDQHGSYDVTVISAATHEAPYVLDELLHHGSSLAIAEHYTHTGGATDHLFALYSLLGFRLCPRLRDFPDWRLASIGPASAYAGLAPLMGKRIRSDVITLHWEDVLRLLPSCSLRPIYYR